MGAQWSQFFPPAPAFTDANVPSQTGRVFIVTGGASGIGLEVAKVLYQKGGKVYLAGRSESNARTAIETIQASVPSSDGSLHFLSLHLEDLSTIRSSVDAFTKRESRLDVLWNNAGVSQPPLGSVSAQGFELQLATNCLGPFLFTQLLLPLLQSTAKLQSHSARVVWLSSQIVELSAPTGGIVMAELSEPPKDKVRNYVTSKAGNYFLAVELARRHGSDGIISVALNPGAANTNLLRYTPWMKFLSRPLLHDPKLAAYTELYAGLSEDVDLEKNGCYVVPWGRIQDIRKDIREATRREEDGGSGLALKFWKFCEEKTGQYAA